MFFAVNLYSDDVVVDVITIRENRNFHLHFFVKSGSLHFLLLGMLWGYLCACFLWVLISDGAFRFLIRVLLDFRMLLLGLNLFHSNSNSYAKKQKIFIFFPLFSAIFL